MPAIPAFGRILRAARRTLVEARDLHRELSGLEPGSREALDARSRSMRSWGSQCLADLGGTLEARGTPPPRGSLIVCNHLSYVDILVLGAALAPVFVSKSEVGSWPLIGKVVRVSGTLLLDRSRIRDIPRVMDAIARVREAGHSVLFFPEGTTTRGDGVAPFRASLLGLAARSRTPVHYAALRYETLPGDLPATDSVCWWGDATLVGHLGKILRLRSFRAELRYGEDTVADEDRHRLAERLHEKVSALFEPVTGAS